MVLLDLGDVVEQQADVFEALFPSDLSKARIHAAPFAVLALNRGLQIFRAGADAGQLFVQQAAVCTLVLRQASEQLGNVLKPFLTGFVGKKQVFIARHRLAAECSLQILFGTRSFQVHSKFLLLLIFIYN